MCSLMPMLNSRRFVAPERVTGKEETEGKMLPTAQWPTTRPERLVRLSVRVFPDDVALRNLE